MFDAATEVRLIISMTKPVLNIKHSIFYRFQCRKPGNGIPRRKPCDLYRDGGCPDRRATDSYYHPISSGSWSSRVNARGLPHTTNSRFLNCSTVHFAPKNTCITKLIQIIFYSSFVLNEAWSVSINRLKFKNLFVATGKKRGRPKKDKSEVSTSAVKVERVEKPSIPDMGGC